MGELLKKQLDLKKRICEAPRWNKRKGIKVVGWVTKSSKSCWKTEFIEWNTGQAEELQQNGKSSCSYPIKADG